MLLRLGLQLMTIRLSCTFITPVRLRSPLLLLWPLLACVFWHCCSHTRDAGSTGNFKCILKTSWVMRMLDSRQ